VYAAEVIAACNRRCVRLAGEEPDTPVEDRGWPNIRSYRTAPSALSCSEMKSPINLRRMGLRKSGPLRGNHPEIGHPCLFCKCPIQAGDVIGHVSQNPDGRESGTLVAHWKCIEDGFNRPSRLPKRGPRRHSRFSQILGRGGQRRRRGRQVPVRQPGRFHSEARPCLRVARVASWSPNGDGPAVLPQLGSVGSWKASILHVRGGLCHQHVGRSASGGPRVVR